MLYVFSFPPGVHVGTLNLIASIPDPSILTLLNKRKVSIIIGSSSLKRKNRLDVKCLDFTGFTVFYLQRMCENSPLALKIF